ncbi:dynein light chain binding protein [Aureococcus anophagefferens]|nr:dynein light chain binding protein [Aureococcus anophagefferens]
MPPVAGNITWARHLLRRIEDPMSRFQSNSAVLASKESKRIVRTYNKVARTLIAFEYLWYEAWCKSVGAARAGLQATLIIRHPHSQKLFVNFDAQVLQLIREAKCLTRMGIDIPEESRMVLSQEDRFKGFYNELKYALSEYDRVCGRIQPQTASVLSPHLQTLECKLRPGMVTLTWTSMNISTYQAQVHLALQQLEDLITKINDLVENRIEKNLKIIARTILVDLPEDKSVTLDEFVSMQELAVREQTEMLVSPLDPSVPDLPEPELSALRVHYNRMTYQALLNCARNSLNQIKKRVCARGGTGFLFVQRPFFEVDVQLSVPSVRLSPSLEDVQRARSTGPPSPF